MNLFYIGVISLLIIIFLVYIKNQYLKENYENTPELEDIPELEDNLTDNKIVLSEETVFDSVSELDSNTKSKNFVNKKWSRDLIDRIENFSLDHIKSKKKVSRDKLLQEFNNKMLNDIPSEERLVSGNKNAAYIAKFWKNINNRLIKTGKVTLVDEHFVYNEKYLEETV